MVFDNWFLSFYFRYMSKSRFKHVNKFINDFWQNFILLFKNGFFQRIKIDYPLVSAYILLQEFPDPKIYWIKMWSSNVAPVLQVVSCLSSIQW